MPYWDQILELVAVTADEDGIPDFDRVRRLFLQLLSQHTGRDTILYASGWIQKPEANDQSVSVTDEDLQALMATSAGLKGPDLDLILHSPGGSVVAAEAIVLYLRSRFSNIRVIVPNLAMSAASMIACAADQLVMGKHSFIGPSDPQVLVATPYGWQLVAAYNVLRQFETAQNAASDTSEMAVWEPMLNQYGPDVLQRCNQSIALTKVLVKSWLEAYLLKHDPRQAEKTANQLTDGTAWGSHSRHIHRDWLTQRNVPIIQLEDEEVFEDLVLSTFHAATHTFVGTESVKIVENQLGRSYIKFENQPTASASS